MANLKLGRIIEKVGEKIRSKRIERFGRSTIDQCIAGAVEDGTYRPSLFKDVSYAGKNPATLIGIVKGHLNERSTREELADDPTKAYLSRAFSASMESWRQSNDSKFMLDLADLVMWTVNAKEIAGESIVNVSVNDFNRMAGATELIADLAVLLSEGGKYAGTDETTLFKLVEGHASNAEAAPFGTPWGQRRTKKEFTDDAIHYGKRLVEGRLNVDADFVKKVTMPLSKLYVDFEIVKAAVMGNLHNPGRAVEIANWYMHDEQTTTPIGARIDAMADCFKDAHNAKPEDIAFLYAAAHSAFKASNYGDQWMVFRPRIDREKLADAVNLFREFRRRKKEFGAFSSGRIPFEIEEILYREELRSKKKTAPRAGGTAFVEYFKIIGIKNVDLNHPPDRNVARRSFLSIINPVYPRAPETMPEDKLRQSTEQSKKILEAWYTLDNHFYKNNNQGVK